MCEVTPYMVLSGEIDESVITSWFNTQAKLTEALNETTHEEGVMSVDSFQSCLCSCLPHKSSESMASLIATAKQSSINSTTINFITALSPDDNGHPSPFVLLLLEQSRAETKTFVNDILKHFAHKSEISVGQLRNALSVLDPSKPEAEVDQAVGIAFSISTGQLVEDNLMIPVDQIAERLLTSPIAKSVYNEAV